MSIQKHFFSSYSSNHTHAVPRVVPQGVSLLSIRVNPRSNAKKPQLGFSGELHPSDAVDGR